MPDDEHVTGDGALPHASGASSQIPGDFRANLTRGDDVVDVATWAGSVPAASGVAPRVRLGSRWFNLLWLLPIGFVGLLGCVAAAKGLRDMPSVQRFITEYPGIDPRADPDGAYLGVPSWARWSHFFNLFFMLFTLRSGLQILADHPRLYWTRHSTPGREWFRMQKPVSADPLWTAKQDSIGLPSGVGLPGIRHSIGLARWWHLGVNTLWLLNGVVFYTLLFVTAQWERLVPTSWSVFPNAASVAIQYMSLDWPRENGWVAYNGLQLLAYFVTVFVAAPLALITGLGMSPALSTRFKRLSRVLNIQTARSVHFLVFAWFVLFIVVHVSLVLTTGLLTNLNHISSGRNDSSWLGFWIFLGWMAVVVAAWVAATPLTLRHPRVVQRVGYGLIGPAQRLFEHVDLSAGEYGEKDISPYFWHNGRYPDSAEYKALRSSGFAEYRLRIGGLVAHPAELSLDDLRKLPAHEQITQHFCIQGWSGVAKWGGVSMATILDLVGPDPHARWVVFYSLGEGSDGGTYYDAHPIEHMRSKLAMLAYDMNDEALSFGHGAPLRLRNELELGFKQVKWIKEIEFVADFADIGSGFGGYNQDHEFFGYRQSL
ncbi:sulfoxide reductase catalytic subunit YedY [Streptomyces achromogenes]|uniref:molybdopterin-dependent oxidoreductase n=1 Tax=Streptomyces achromogenes TaxID=67255 RepID=UPI002782A111|nr:molybdopterin-dependent oxidoreductase [Streptomyces achromogenes]MDQ0834591.1 sulfoxide reductase catalytic subunit YedY [Streptomyces achromogenes]